MITRLNGGIEMIASTLYPYFFSFVSNFWWSMCRRLISPLVPFSFVNGISFFFFSFVWVADTRHPATPKFVAFVSPHLLFAFTCVVLKFWERTLSRGRLGKREESFRNQGFYENCPELVKKRNKFLFMVEGSEIIQNVSEESIHQPFCRGFFFFL